MKPTIVVDFDGTMCDFAFPSVGAPKDGLKEALTRFRELGYWVIISSCRTAMWHADIFQRGEIDKPVMERSVVKSMVQFLHDNDVPFDEVDDGTKGKPVADFYIDDKGVRFENNWPEIQAFVESNTR